jgi:8-oxo-dGTP diphosphatase
MNPSSRREIACAILLDVAGNFLLQQRDDIPGIIHPGKIGLFGGHLEGNETFLQCVAREIREEISFFVPPERFEYLASYEGEDPEVKGRAFRGEFFVTHEIPIQNLTITEGALLMVKPDQLSAIARKLTPTAQFALSAFLNRSRRAFD